MKKGKNRLLAILTAVMMLISVMAACKDKTPPIDTPKPVTVTVGFDKQGGAGTAEDKTVTVGEAYGALPDVTQTGQDFGGWFYDAAGTGAAVTAATIVVKEENHTLYAKWTAKSVAVTLDAGAGTVSPASLDVTYGGTYGTLPTPSLYGYTFGGWWTGANGAGLQVTASTPVTNASAHSLFAKWTAISGIAVSFDLVDGDAIWLGTAEDGFADKEVTFDEAYGSLPDKNDIELADHFFGGWYLDFDGDAYSGAVYSGTAVKKASAHTLYTKWIHQSEGFEILFDLNYTSAPALESKYVEEHAAYGELPEPTRTGYNFAGWYTEDGTGEDWGDAVNGATLAGDGLNSTTVYAKWEGKPTAILFNANDFSNGGAGSTDASGVPGTSVTATYGEAMPSAGSAPTRPGYTFKGYWDTNAASGGKQYYTDASTPVSANNWDKDNESATLYARWTAITYTVTYNDNKPAASTGSISGTTVTSSAFTFDIQGNLKNMTRALTGWDFKGWDTVKADADNGDFDYVNQAAVLNLADTQGATVTLYAAWKAKTTTITFALSTNSTGTTVPQGAIAGVTVIAAYDSVMPTLDTENAALVAPTRYGYTFDGFFRAQTGAGTNQQRYYNADMTPGLGSAVGNAQNIWNQTAGEVTIHSRWTAKSYAVTYNLLGGTWPSGVNGGNPPAYNLTFDSTGSNGYGNSTSSDSTFNTRFPGVNNTNYPTLAGNTFIGWWTKNGTLDGDWGYQITSRSTRVATMDTVIYARWRDDSETSWNFSNPNDYAYFSGDFIAAKNIDGKNWIEIIGFKKVKMLVPVSVGDTIKFTVVFEIPKAGNDALMFLKNDGAWMDDNIKINDINPSFVTANAAYGQNAYDVTFTIWNKAGAWGTEEFYLVFANELYRGGGNWTPAYIRLTDIEVARLDKNKTSWDFSTDGDYDYFFGDFLAAKNIDGKNWIEVIGLKKTTMLIPVSVGDTIKFTVVFEISKAGNDALMFIKNDNTWMDDNIKINDINPSFVTANAAYGPNAYDVTFTIWNKAGAWGTKEFYLVFANELYRGGGNWTPAYIRLTDIEVVRLNKNKTSWDFSTDGDYDYFLGDFLAAKNIDGKNWMEIIGWKKSTMLIPVSVGDTIKFTVVFEIPKAGNDALMFLKNDGAWMEDNIKINDINPSSVTANAAYGPNAYDVTFKIWDQGGAWGTKEFYLVFANELYRGGGNWAPAYIRLTDIEIIRAA